METGILSSQDAKKELINNNNMKFSKSDIYNIGEFNQLEELHESEESEELELDSDGEEDIDDVNKVLEWEPIPDEKQKRFDRMGPQDDVSDASSSDAESEEEEETKKMRSLNANEGESAENEDRENALTLHLKKCQNEDEETLQERREKRVAFTSIFKNKDNCSGDEKNECIFKLM